jgi:hypothetical protein
MQNHYLVILSLEEFMNFFLILFPLNLLLRSCVDELIKHYLFLIYCLACIYFFRNSFIFRLNLIK